MASNYYMIIVLMLAFYTSSGSLLLSREGQACPPGRDEHHLERHQYRRPRVPKRSLEFEDKEEMPRYAVVDVWSPYESASGPGSPVEVDNSLSHARQQKRFVQEQRYDSVGNQLSWRKRNQPEVHAGGGTEHHPPKTPAELLTQRLTSQFVFRSPRGHRQYDVPQIECPQAEDGMDRFACPTPDRMGRYRCVDDHVLCDGFIDCPNGEDEDRQACMFYKTTKAHLDVLADAVLRWARGR